MRLDDELDRQIEAALTTYAEPAEGIDEQLLTMRTMASIRASGKPRRGWLWAMFAVPTLACLLVLAFTFQKPVRRLQPYSARLAAPMNPAQDIRRPLPVANHSTRHRVASAGRQTPIHAKRQMPKLDQFPSPKPATATEIALLDFAENSTAAEKQAALFARQKTTEAVTIADIRIPPLNPTLFR